MRSSGHFARRPTALFGAIVLLTVGMACSRGGRSDTDAPTGPAPTTPVLDTTTVAPVVTDTGNRGTTVPDPTSLPSSPARPEPVDQLLPAPGYGYLELPDGTTLSINVMFPSKADDGPFPTVVEYSGYDPSNPDSGLLGRVFNALGYAYVGVNLRGSGCSGGSFALFDEQQAVDGYDMIETIAAQPWVLHGRVGMVGISYSGITQLFVAATRPPSLAAITPLSVFDDGFRSTLYPGGILNRGFAVEWATERTRQAQPFGQTWTRRRADAGDTTCAANQAERTGNEDAAALIVQHPYYDPAVADRFNPSLYVDRIEVPVFLAGAWQDEQTGGRFPALLDRFAPATKVYATLMNGLHTESLGLGALERYYEFLDFYVARRTPRLGLLASVIPTVVYWTLFDSPGLLLPLPRFSGLDYQAALARFESEPRVRVLFEEGAASGTKAGSPVPRFEQSFTAWPPPGVIATPLRLSPGAGGTSYTYDPDAVPNTFYEGSETGIWKAGVRWTWPAVPDDNAVGFESSPYVRDTVLVGPASADLWIASSTPDTDIEVTITEVRPDGEEVFVQSGRLRVSQRALDPARSTALRPVHTHLEADRAPLTPGTPTLVRVEVLPFAHVFRSGSRLRVLVGSPGGNHAHWSFDNLPAGGTVRILTDDSHPSRVMLPVLPGISVPDERPPCGALRGQPCRTYRPLR